jgi:uncharacterized protein
MSLEPPNRADQAIPACGDFDIRIDQEGAWYYRGSVIARPELVRLFASVLSRDDRGEYWLTTPAEKGRIQVDDVPFVAVAVTASGKGEDQELEFLTNVGDRVIADRDHPIRVARDPATRGPIPYVTVRRQIEARIARSVYYDLVELGEEKLVENRPILGVWSKGAFFTLGELDESHGP